MNQNADFDRIAQSWLQDGPTEMPDRSLQAALDEVHVTSQRRFGAARRTFSVNGKDFRHAAAAVVGILIIVAGGAYLQSNATGGVGGSPRSTATATPKPRSTPSPPPSPSPTPTRIDTTSWVPFSSDRFGYDIAIPPTWNKSAATRDWSLADRETTVNEGTDNFNVGVEGAQVGVTAFSAPVPPGMSPEAWLAAYIAPDRNGEPTTACTPVDQWEAVTVDGQPALFNPDACDASQAFVFIGDRAYVFSVWRPGQVPWLKAFLSTVRFHPSELAASPSASP